MGKFIGFILGLVLFCVALIGGVGVAGYYYVLNTYDIDIVKTVKDIETLTQPVDEATICPNAFTADDMVDVQATINNSVKDFITYTEDGGYVVNFDKLSEAMTQMIRLTDKQVGAIAQEVVEQEIEGKIKFGDENVNVALKQIDFYDVADKGACFNVVIAVDMTALKNPGDAVLNYFSALIPDKMYVSSTVKVTHGAENFSYSVAHEELKINNLTAEDTEDLFHTLDVLFKVGSVATWNEYVGTTIMNALVGNAENKGLAYGLQEAGATDYAFVTEAGEDYFAVLHN